MMYGGYVWASVGLAVIALGALIAYVTIQYTRGHVRRMAAGKRLSQAVPQENYRHPVEEGR